MQKRFFNLIAGVFTFFLLAFASVSSFGQDPQKAKMTDFGRGYLEYLPSGYSTSTTKYPAIIFLHGSGERGTGSATDLAKVKRQGPPKLIAAGHKMGFTVNGKTEYFIVLSPQTNEWSWKYDVVPFAKWALENYRIDPDRLYVTGLSMGGEGTWFSAGLDDNSPNLFAAIAVMAGRGTLSLGQTVASRHLSVWAFHGDADTSLGIGGGLLPVTGMLNVGANPAPIWTVYPGVGHSGCWERAYTPDHTYHNPNVYEWFLSKRKPGATAPPSSSAPVANAGADKSLTQPSASTSFTASATDADGTIASYTWSKISGPSATLSNTTSKTLSVANATSVGTYTFRVTVKDNSNLTDTDDVVLTVSSTASGTGQAPTVSAGADKTINLPSSSASFYASASDPDGTIASYTWTKVSGPSASLVNATTKTLSVKNATTAGTYVFRVTVKDNNNNTKSDDVSLIVKGTTTTTASTTGTAPTANAGADKTIHLPSSSASFYVSANDSDGQVVSYSWTKVAGPSATLSNTTGQTLSVKNAVTPGTYTFRVSVKDNKNNIDTDDVNLIVAQ